MPVTDAIRRRRVDDALVRMTPRQRRVLSLLLVARLTPAEVAVTLRVPLREVERLHAAGLARLARAASATRSRVPVPLRRAA
jgi:DNA-directed RNA polymerase specialized sigma24 family protein